MTDDERMNNLTALATMVTAQVIEGLAANVRCCINCQFFVEQSELCTNKNNCPQEPARPPARVIALGCPNHQSGVPF